MPLPSVSNIPLSGYHFLISSLFSLIIRLQAYQDYQIHWQFLPILDLMIHYHNPLHTPSSPWPTHTITLPGLKKTNSEKSNFIHLLHLNQVAECGWRKHTIVWNKWSLLKFMTLHQKCILCVVLSSGIHPLSPPENKFASFSFSWNF